MTTAAPPVKPPEPFSTRTAGQNAITATETYGETSAETKAGRMLSVCGCAVAGWT